MTAIDPASPTADKTKLSYNGNEQGGTTSAQAAAPSQTIRDRAVNSSARTRPAAAGAAVRHKEGAWRW